MKRPGSKRHGTKKFLGVIMAVGIIAAGTYAFTAANTVPDTKAGIDSGTISGFDITNVTYDNTLDPESIATYSFDLDAAATRVDAKIDASQLTYDTCVNTLANSWTCTANGLLGVDTLDADELTVVAVQ